MTRNIGLERVFNLGDYKSLRITDYINDIPDELALDEGFMYMLRYLQLLEVEGAYYSYSLMSKDMKDEFETDGLRFEALREITINTYQSLAEKMQTILIKEN